MKRFIEKESENLLNEICGDFNCKWGNYEEDKANGAPKSLLKEDLEQAKLELDILVETEKKLREHLKTLKQEFKKAGK